MNVKIKITNEGQPCRKCGTPVKKCTHKSLPKSNPGGYYFSYWFVCPTCKTFYLVKSAKIYYDASRTPSLQSHMPQQSIEPVSNDDEDDNPPWEE